MNRYSWVCFGGAHPHIQPGSSLRRGASSSSSKADEFGGEVGRVGGKRVSSAREGAGGCVPASHATRATILSGKRDYFTPAAAGEAEAGSCRFPQPEPPSAGPGSVPTRDGRGGSPPRPPTTPMGTKRAKGCPKRSSGPWVPGEGGRPPHGRAGRHYGGPHATL